MHIKLTLVVQHTLVWIKKQNVIVFLNRRELYNIAKSNTYDSFNWKGDRGREKERKITICSGFRIFLETILVRLTMSTDSRLILFLSLGYRYRRNRSCETLSRREWKADDRIKANRTMRRRYWRIEREVNQRWSCGPELAKYSTKNTFERAGFYISLSAQSIKVGRERFIVII